MDHTTPYGLIDSLSDVSNNYEDLNNQFIRPSLSSIGPPVLFIRKRIVLSTSLYMTAVSTIHQKGLVSAPTYP